MKFGFVSCVKLGLSCMEAIYEINGQLDLVITLKDTQAISKSGRVYLDAFCEKHQIPLLKSSHVNNQEVLDEISRRDIDWLFIIGWSQIANSELLAAPKKGVLGMHPTLLPVGRGRASIPWAILKGMKKTGVTMFKLDAGVDTGPIVEQVEINISDDEDASTLYSKVNKAHIELIKSSYPLLCKNSLQLKEQNEDLATEWVGRTPADGEIDLNGSLSDAERLIRATSRPYPGAFVLSGSNKRIVWKASKKITGNREKLIFPDGELELVDYKDC